MQQESLFFRFVCIFNTKKKNRSFPKIKFAFLSFPSLKNSSNEKQATYWQTN